MDKYLVTGGAGFIGSNIVGELLNRNEYVRVLDNFSTGKYKNLLPFKNNKNLEIINGDICNKNHLKKSIKDIDYVLHHAANPSVMYSVKNPILSTKTNIIGTLNVLEYAQKYKIKRMIFASSCSIYGEEKTLPKIENMPAEPISPYAIGKYASEQYCQTYYKLYGLETVILRYFNVFGPNQDASSEYSSVISNFIKAIKNGKSPIIYGDGTQTRDFIYVSNIVKANLLSCTAPNIAGEIINIGGGKQYTILEIVKIINKILNTSIDPIFKPNRPGEIKHSLSNIDKAQKLLNFKINKNFEDGLKYLIYNFNFSNF